jgi:ribonuclease T1
VDRRTRTRISALVLVAVLVLALVGSLLSTTAPDPDEGQGGEVGAVDLDQDLLPGPTDVPAEAPGEGPVDSGDDGVDRFSDLPPIGVSQLPVEAVDTILLIDRGGPFPYDRDGITGFYREYTVPTPGESDRGARRLVVGQDGAVYYTADHYESFSEVVGD